MHQVFIVENLPKTGFELNLKATDEECKQLATQINVEQVASFTAKLLISQWRRGGVHIEGTFTSTLTQQCVISLDSFDTILDEKIDQKFFASTKIPEYGEKKEVEMIDNDMDPPEALVDGALNIFDYLAETMLLQLDPYPKKPDSQLESLAQDGKFEINQPNMEDPSTHDAAGNEQPKPKATHKPFANLNQLLKDK